MESGKWIVYSEMTGRFKPKKNASLIYKIMFRIFFPLIVMAWAGMVAAPMVCLGAGIAAVAFLIGATERPENISNWSLFFLLGMGTFGVLSCIGIYRKLSISIRLRIISIETILYACGASLGIIAVLLVIAVTVFAHI